MELIFNQRVDLCRGVSRCILSSRNIPAFLNPIPALAGIPTDHSYPSRLRPLIDPRYISTTRYLLIRHGVWDYSHLGNTILHIREPQNAVTKYVCEPIARRGCARIDLGEHYKERCVYNTPATPGTRRSRTNTMYRSYNGLSINEMGDTVAQQTRCR